MIASIAAAPLHVVRIRYHPRGAAAELFGRRDPEVLLSGPAGTGKSLAALHKIHLAASKYPGMRGIMMRRVRTDMWESTMRTFEDKVLHYLDGVRFRSQEQEYRYPNGSVLVVAGLDRPGKVMSAEYDMAYIQEAVDLDTEDAWEQVTTRLRNWVMPYQQLIADCNPSAPTHWLKRRCDGGQTVMLESRHEDNPRLFEANGDLTDAGEAYMAKLDALTGVRYLRLRKGIWAAAEGMVYGDDWDPQRNLIDAPASWERNGHGRAIPPRDWPRYWSIDFGFTNPFCWAAWAMDPDGRLYRYREIYRTQRIVEDHCGDIWREMRDEPFPAMIICDHDAEDRATLERHLTRLYGRPVRTRPAHKPIAPGIDATRARMRLAGDGRARLFLVRGSLIYRDPELADAKKPTCTEEEIENYVYPTPKANRAPDESPVDTDNHGCLVRGTMVETSGGPRPIESIGAGAMVLTRGGWRTVLAAGMTHAAARVWRLRLLDGRDLVGTGDHPIWVEGCGWKRLDALRQGEALRVCDPSLSCSTVLTFGAIRNQRTGLIRCTSAHLSTNDRWALGACMRRFGSRTSERFQRGTTSTISTETRSTTISRISRASMHTLTKPSMSVIAAIMASTGLQSNGPCLLLQNGTHPRTGRLGIASRRNVTGVSEKSGQSDVSDVARTIEPKSLVTRSDSAQTSAERQLDGTPVWTTNPALVRAVEPPFESTATPSGGAVAGHVLSVSEEPLPQPVYNLTVEGVPEFYANGILVHNCDQMRYVVATLDLTRSRALVTF